MAYDILDFDEGLGHPLTVVDLELIFILEGRGGEREGVGEVLAIVIEGRRDGGARPVFAG